MIYLRILERRNAKTRADHIHVFANQVFFTNLSAIVMKIKFNVKILFRNKVSLRVCDNIEIKNTYLTLKLFIYT